MLKFTQFFEERRRFIGTSKVACGAVKSVAQKVSLKKVASLTQMNLAALVEPVTSNLSDIVLVNALWSGIKKKQNK